MDEMYVVLVHRLNKKDIRKSFDTYDEALKYMGIMGKPKEHEKRMKEMKDEP